jgi:protein SCO1/2
MNMLRATLMAALFMSVTARAESTLPRALQDVAFDQKLDSQVPLELTFRDELGQSTTLKECVNGKPTILVLAYYRCPMLCNLVLNGLTQALRDISFDIGNEFEVVTVSFDARETAELAAAKRETYMNRYGRLSASGWHFLTGNQPSIDALAGSVGFRYRYDPARDEFAHASGIVLLTPNGKVSRYFYDVKFSPRDLRLGLVEASHNQIGSPVDQILLFCFHYDPTEGKYGATVMRLVRLGGGLTMLVVVAGLWLLARSNTKQGIPAAQLGEAPSLARALDARMRCPRDEQRNRALSGSGIDDGARSRPLVLFRNGCVWSSRVVRRVSADLVLGPLSAPAGQL